MRCCMITTFYPPHHFGGDAIFVYRLSHALASLGHEVDVFYSEDAFLGLGGKPAASGYPDHPSVRRQPLRSRLGLGDLLLVQQAGRPFSHASTLGAVFERGRYDVVHFHNVSLMGAPSLLGRATETDAVTLYTLHEHWLVCPMHVLWRFDREPCETRTCLRCQLHGRRPPQLWRYTSLRDRALQGVDAILAPSRFTLNKHLELGLGVTPRYFPHFVPEPELHQAGSSPRERPFFLFAGRLERLKGAEDVIQAARTFPDADFVLAGDGGDRARLEQLARGMENVVFAGRLPPIELTRYYQHAVASIVPSLCYEVFGLSVVESFACGTPAIVRDRGALTELAEESGAGLTFRTPEELTDALRRVFSDDGLRREMSARARSSYESRWRVQGHVDAYLGMISELKARA